MFLCAIYQQWDYPNKHTDKVFFVCTVCCKLDQIVKRVFTKCFFFVSDCAACFFCCVPIKYIYIKTMKCRLFCIFCPSCFLDVNLLVPSEMTDFNKTLSSNKSYKIRCFVMVRQSVFFVKLKGFKESDNQWKYNNFPV